MYTPEHFLSGLLTRAEADGYFIARDNFGHEQTLKIDAESPPAEVLESGQARVLGQPVIMVPGHPFFAIGARLANGTVHITRLHL